MTDPAYNHGWSAIRRHVLRRDRYRCQLQLPGCTGTATTVDHITSPIDAWHLRLTPSNLRAACTHCNSSRGATDRIARSNGKPPPPTRLSAPPSRDW